MKTCKSIFGNKTSMLEYFCVHADLKQSYNYVFLTLRDVLFVVFSVA